MAGRIHAQPRQMRFDHLTVNEGLPTSFVFTLKQDGLGYMWIATENGLVRYDGYEMKVYRPGLRKRALNNNTRIPSMMLDHNGSLWMATDGNGLFRYNRSTDCFAQYPYPQNTGQREIHSAIIQAEDSAGNLWLIRIHPDLQIQGGTVLKLNKEAEHFETFDKYQKGAHYLPVSNVNTIYKGLDGRIWLGADEGLFVFNERSNAFSPERLAPDTIRSMSVLKLYEAPLMPGIRWIYGQNKATKQCQLLRLDTRTGRSTLYDSRSIAFLEQNMAIHFFSMQEDKHRRFWVAAGGQLLYFNPQTARFVAYEPVDSIKGHPLRYISITEAPDGLLWLGSSAGLLSFNPDTHRFQRYIEDQDDHTSLGGTYIRGAITDSSGLLWVRLNSTNTSLDRQNKLTSAFYVKTKNENDSLAYPGGITSQIFTSPDGDIILNNATGVYIWKPDSDRFKRIYKLAIPPGGLGSALTLNSQGALYFINEKKLREYNIHTGKLRSFELDTADLQPGFSDYRIDIIKQDHTGLIWIGTINRGICVFNPENHQSIWYPFISRSKEAVRHNIEGSWINDILEDSNGNMWIASQQDGLCRFDRQSGKFISFMNDGNTTVNDINTLFEDGSGRLWVGTFYNGLYEFDRKTGLYTHHFDETNGLLLNEISNISQDSSGSLWVASIRGLTRIQPESGFIKNYPLNAVLPGNHTLSTYSSLVYTNGLMLLALQDGFAYFNPNDLAANPHPPLVHIEQIGYSNPRAQSDSATTRNTYGLQQLELPWNQNRISFRYVALHFVDPAQNKYAYLLEGYDKQWVQAGTTRSVTYTNLPPATYTFRVRACNSDGVWNNRGDSFTFTILSPWWTRWWAWVLYTVLVAAAIYAFTTYRSRNLIRDKQLLEQRISQRTHQLSEQQEQIIQQRDKLAETVTDLKTAQQQLIQSEKLASLGELTAGIAHEIQNPLNFVNNFSEVSRELVDEMQAELKNGDPAEAMAIADDIKQNLEKIHHHGKRADGIVKNMLQHSRNNSGERQPTDINALADEYLRLSYHGLRAKDKSFNATMTTHFQEGLPMAGVVPQDMGRVLLNLFNNAFYAVSQKSKTATAGYKPEVVVSTAARDGQVSISVRDNGTGIPEGIRDKVLQPFFTTKPTGEGTGLGLSLSYDTVVKGHGGTLKINSREGEWTEFIITLAI